jgi:hypothetical protein
MVNPIVSAMAMAKDCRGGGKYMACHLLQGISIG